MIPAWRQLVRDGIRKGGSVCGIGEPIWPGRSPAELTECQRQEWLLNTAFVAGPGWRLLCPYDVNVLNEHVIEEARRSHPVIRQDGTRRASDKYLDGDCADRFAGTLDAPAFGAREFSFTYGDLGGLRRFAAARAGDLDLDAERTAQLVLAMNELAT